MNNKNYNNNKLWLLAIALFFFDQLTKIVADWHLPYDQEFLIASWVSFLKDYNETTFMLIYDAEMLNMSHSIFTMTYSVIAFIIFIGVVWVSKHKAMRENVIEVKFALSGLFIILAGSMGNLADRIIRGKVVDFVKINLSENYEPVINAADIMIYVGLFFIILSWSVIVTKFLKNCFLKKTS